MKTCSMNLIEWLHAQTQCSQEDEDFETIEPEADMRDTHQVQWSKDFQKIWKTVTSHFKSAFFENKFGFTCDIWDPLWFKKDVKSVTAKSVPILSAEFSNKDVTNFEVCSYCHTHLYKDKIPPVSKSASDICQTWICLHKIQSQRDWDMKTLIELSGKSQTCPWTLTPWWCLCHTSLMMITHSM